MAAGSVTMTDQNLVDKAQFPCRKILLAWTSDASGNVSGTLTPVISGTLARVVFIPGSGGTQPSSLYDVTLLDESGVDVLGGQGANLSNSTVAQVAPGCPLKDGTTVSTTAPQMDDRLELQVANAGNAKTGTVVLYVR